MKPTHEFWPRYAIALIQQSSARAFSLQRLAHIVEVGPSMKTFCQLGPKRSG